MLEDKQLGESLVETGIIRKKGTIGAFSELLSIFLKQDFSLPVLEVFAFLFAVGTLLEYGFSQGYNTTYIAYSYFGSSGTFSIPILAFMILIWKNISFGFGGDFEKGVMQTFLIYPLSRGMLLTARLISSVGIPLVLLSIIQVLALFLMTPRFATIQAPALIFNYLSILATPLLISAVVLVVSLFAKNSGTALITGIVFYFVVAIFLDALIPELAARAQNLPLLSFVYLMNPAVAAQYYYNYNFNGGFGFGVQFNPAWGIPSFGLLATYLVANFVISALVLYFCFLFFAKKVEV